MCCYHNIVVCSTLLELNNGIINCSLGNDGVPTYEDSCTIVCQPGYELIGTKNRTCKSDGSWSGTMILCTKGTEVLYIWVLHAMLISH